MNFSNLEKGLMASTCQALQRSKVDFSGFKFFFNLSRLANNVGKTLPDKFTILTCCHLAFDQRLPYIRIKHICISQQILGDIVRFAFWRKRNNSILNLIKIKINVTRMLDTVVIIFIILQFIVHSINIHILYVSIIYV